MVAANDKKRHVATEENTFDDYDPHQHRNVLNPTTNFETFVHILKSILGTGILAMPEAYKNVGILVGFVSTIFATILITYCVHQMINSDYIICKRLKVAVLTYPEAMRAILENGPQRLRKYGRLSEHIVVAFIIIYQLGACCIYVLFVAVNIKAIVDDCTKSDVALELYLVGLFVPFLLLMLVRNLKLLVPFNLLSDVISLVSFSICFYHICRNLPPVTDRPLYSNFYTYPLFFGTCLFALDTVAIVTALENSMKTPKSFGGYCGVFNIAMMIVMVLYLGIGTFGYWKFGDEAKSSVTLNLPPDDFKTSIARGFYATAIYISYNIQAYPAIKILWEWLLKKLERRKSLPCWEYILRISIVLLTFLLPACIPLLGLFISILGSFCMPGLGIVFPAIMETLVKWPDQLGPWKFVLVKNIFIIILGIIALFVGCYIAGREIIVKLNTRF